MLNCFRYFIKSEYEITPTIIDDINAMKSDWYFIKVLFDDDEYDIKLNHTRISNK
jgi:hypothetical protein